MKELYLVTGATGHLGNTVAHRLARAGRQVRALVLPGEEHAPQLPGGVEAVAGDVRSPASLEALFAGAEGRDVTVIHCAGIVSIASRFDQNVYDVNVTGTKNVVDACVRRGVKKLVHVSSVHALPEKPGGAPVWLGCTPKQRPRPRPMRWRPARGGWTSASCIPRASAARMTTAMDT